jgi:hypothetical protein
VRGWGHSLPGLAAAVALTVTVGCEPAPAQAFPGLEQRTLLAQAGSIGGSVGKKDKSISGEEEKSSVPDAGSGRATRANREDAFPKTIQLNEHWHGLNYTVSLRNVGGGNYQGTWSHGYVTKFVVSSFTGNFMKMERTDNPAFGAVTGTYTGTRTGNRAAGEASVSNGAVSKWDASW